MQESVDVVGRSTAEVGGVLQAILGDDGAHQFAMSGPDSFRLVRTYRPTWATVAGVTTFLVCGLGLLFLFVKRTETCVLTVVSGPTGAVLTISGTMEAGRVAALREALSGTVGRPADESWSRPPEPALPGPVGPPPSFAAPAPPDDPSEMTVARPAAVVERPQPEPDGPRVRLEDGTSVVLGPLTLIGRNPAPQEPGDAPTLIPLADASISKTHLSLRVRGEMLVAEDLHSTNGTRLIAPGGAEHHLVAGRPEPVVPGTRLLLGGCSLEVLGG